MVEKRDMWYWQVKEQFTIMEEYDSGECVKSSPCRVSQARMI